MTLWSYTKRYMVLHELVFILSGLAAGVAVGTVILGWISSWWGIPVAVGIAVIGLLAKNEVRRVWGPLED